MAIEALPIDLPFQEAIDYFTSKGLHVSPNSWRDVWQDANARAFTVSRVTATDVLADIKSAMQRAINDGSTLRDFKKSLRPVLEAKGWYAPEGEKAITIGPDGLPRKRLNGWRLDTIFNANVQTAYSVGRYTQQMEVASARPYWQYHAVLDAVTRPSHAAMDRKIYDYRHPIWAEWYPPNGFFCRCFVTTLSADDVKNCGLSVGTKGVDVHPDEGWRYNVGQAGLDAYQPNLDKYSSETTAPAAKVKPEVPAPSPLNVKTRKEMVEIIKSKLAPLTDHGIKSIDFDRESY
jgi:SPP1 gp7 family putative phage head morphogenesis protein